MLNYSFCFESDAFWSSFWEASIWGVWGCRKRVEHWSSVLLGIFLFSLMMWDSKVCLYSVWAEKQWCIKIHKRNIPDKFRRLSSDPQMLNIYWLFCKYFVKCSSETYARFSRDNRLFVTQIQAYNIFLGLRYTLKNKQ